MTRAVIENKLLHRCQGIGSIGRAGAVDAKVVVLRPLRQVAAIFQATVHQHRVIGRWRQQQIFIGSGQAGNLPVQCPASRA